MLKKNRLFIKDFDGSLLEVPQTKMAVRGRAELRRLKKAVRKGGATCYGAQHDLDALI